MYISLANKIVVVLIVIVIIIVVLSTMIIDSLSVPAVRLSTVGRGTLPVDGACIWNDLPSHITSSPSLLTFKQRLKHLFRPILVSAFCCEYCKLFFLSGH